MSEYTGSLVSVNYFSGSNSSEAAFDIALIYSSGSKESEGDFLSPTEYTPNSLINGNIIYRMKAFNTNLNSYVYWYTRQKPDLTGRFSDYPINHLSDIVIHHRRFI